MAAATGMLDPDRLQHCIAKAERVVLHGSDQEVRQLLRACDCYDEFLHDLKTDPTYAAAVLKCVTSANKDKLVNAVNALPQDS